MTRPLIALAVCFLAGCGDLPWDPKVEFVCMAEKTPMPEGGYIRQDIGFSVDGRLVFSDYGYSWYWADTQEPVDWRLSNLLGDELNKIAPKWNGPEHTTPHVPLCVQLKMAGEPCDDCL